MIDDRQMINDRRIGPDPQWLAALAASEHQLARILSNQCVHRSPDGIELGPGEALIAWKNLPSQTFCGVSGVLIDNGENLSPDEPIWRVEHRGFARITVRLTGFRTNSASMQKA